VRTAAFKKGIVLPEVVATRTMNEYPTNLVFRPSLCNDVKASVMKGDYAIKMVFFYAIVN